MLGFREAIQRKKEWTISPIVVFGGLKFIIGERPFG
jgi:hypothetical protein